MKKYEREESHILNESEKKLYTAITALLGRMEMVKSQIPPNHRDALTVRKSEDYIKHARDGLLTGTAPGENDIMDFMAIVQRWEHRYSSDKK